MTELPAWTWIGYLYEMNKKVIVIDSDNLMSMLERRRDKDTRKARKGEYEGGNAEREYLVNEIGWVLKLNGKEIPYEPILALADENDFEKHEALADKLGFELFVKRARIGTAKHVRVRPRFENWSATGTITVSDPQLTEDMLTTIFCFPAGRYAGIGDWRTGFTK